MPRRVRPEGSVTPSRCLYSEASKREAAHFLFSAEEFPKKVNSHNCLTCLLSNQIFYQITAWRPFYLRSMIFTNLIEISCAEDYLLPGKRGFCQSVPSWCLQGEHRVQWLRGQAPRETFPGFRNGFQVLPKLVGYFVAFFICGMGVTAPSTWGQCEDWILQAQRAAIPKASTECIHLQCKNKQSTHPGFVSTKSLLAISVGTCSLFWIWWHFAPQ